MGTGEDYPGESGEIYSGDDISKAQSLFAHVQYFTNFMTVPKTRIS